MLFGFQPEMRGHKLADATQLVISEGRCFRSGRKFCNLFGVIDIRKYGEGPRIIQQPLHGGLSHRSVGTFQESELLDFFDPIDEPTLGAVVAVIIRREDGVGRVFALEHSRGVGNSDQELGWGMGRLSNLVEVRSRMLFQKVIDVLHHIRFAAGNGRSSLSDPANGGTEGNSAVTELSFTPEILHDLPQGIIVYLGLTDIVELEDIDVIGAESFERRLHGAPDGCWTKTLGDFFLTTHPIAMVHEILADLGGDHDPRALGWWEGLGNELLAPSVAVGVGSVKERDAEIGGLPHEEYRFLVGKVSPPSRGDSPETEADFTDLEIRVVVECAILHRETIIAS